MHFPNRHLSPQAGKNMQAILGKLEKLGKQIHFSNFNRKGSGVDHLTINSKSLGEMGCWGTLFIELINIGRFILTVSETVLETGDPQLPEAELSMRLPLRLDCACSGMSCSVLLLLWPPATRHYVTNWGRVSCLSTWHKLRPSRKRD